MSRICGRFPDLRMRVTAARLRRQTSYTCPGGPVGGDVLDDAAVLGREQRLAGRRIRRAAELRDGGCVFTGCSAPTHWCDVHHLVHWSDGGETSPESSALWCERHHTDRPDGSEITTPAALVPAA